MAHDTPDAMHSIRDTARGFLRAECDFARVRRIIESDAGWDKGLWQRFGIELGFAGLGIAEAHGGAGLGIVELAVVAEELGAVLAPIPWFETSVLAAMALQFAGETHHLAGIASGHLTATLTISPALNDKLFNESAPRIVGNRLTGTAHFVPFGHVADLLLVTAHEDELTLLALPSNTQGVRIERLATMDATRPLSHVHFDSIPISPYRAGPPNGGSRVMQYLAPHAAAILAAEQVGGMQRTLDEVVAYSKQRVQFGRLIGSFQALKHRMADMKMKLEAARSATIWACTKLAEQNAEAAIACAGARAYCSDAFLDLASEGIQLHGGIGFTWDHHAHLFFKRARATASLLATAADLRESIACALLGNSRELMA